MKFYTNIELAKIFFSIFLYIWIIGISLLVVNHALSCVTSDGCLKSQCSYEWLRDEYKVLIDNNAYKCRNRQINNITITVDKLVYVH